MKMPWPTPDGDLPSLRVQKALEKATEEARAHNLDPNLIRQIVRSAIGVVAEGTYRSGDHHCPDCHSPVTWHGASNPICPRHGNLRGRPLELAVIFPPVSYGGA